VVEEIEEDDESPPTMDLRSISVVGVVNFIFDEDIIVPAGT